MENQENTQEIQESRYKITHRDYNDENFGKGYRFGYSKSEQNTNVLSGLCPFCNESSGFKQVTIRSNKLVPLLCDTCGSYVLYHTEKKTVLPIAKPNALKGLPDNIDKYYQEALNCIASESPNGAATLFRKLIHAVGVYYKVAETNDKSTIMQIVGKIEEAGHINKKLVDALKGVKDLGNDGAHINENEPNMEQIYLVKDLIDSFLQATVLQDQNITALTEKRQTKKQECAGEIDEQGTSP